MKSSQSQENLLRGLRNMEITVQCPVYPTEDQQRVEVSLRHFFPESIIQTKHQDAMVILSITSDRQSSLSWLRNQIHSIRIIDAVHSGLISRWDGERAYIQLDKQAAYQGKIRLLDSDDYAPPLGSIQVTIKLESNTDFEDFLSWFTPRTKEGRIIEG